MSVGQVSLFSSIVILGYVTPQEYYEERRHMAYSPPMDRIPREFTIKGDANANKEFEKYANSIHHLAKEENKTIIYKIKVDIVKHHVKGNLQKILKKGKSKKFNVPLKKNSMKLSNFEAFIKKMATDNNKKNPHLEYYRMTTTEKERFTPRQFHIKFKPIISKLNSFTKIVKPVKNRIITLTN